MKSKLILCVFSLVLFTFGGCEKIKGLLPGKKQPTAAATPAPQGNSTAAPSANSDVPAPTQPTTQAPPPVAEKQATAPAAPAAQQNASAPAANTGMPFDSKSQVVVFCYHRLEGKAGGALSIEPELFEKQMQELKDRNIAVISMQDFLAWRRGEKGIPPKCVVITIDDGYVSGYDVGLPILKKFGYPATFFIYSKFVNVGGKSMSWEQLSDLRDQGYDIGSHTVSHQDLRKKPGKEAGDYESWLKKELEESKQLLEQNLGIKVSTIAYPFGLHNTKVHEATKAAGYEGGFTTYGQRLTHGADAFALGRYDVTAKDAQGRDGFTAGVSFEGPLTASAAPSAAMEASGLMITEPMNNSTTNNAQPKISANLSSLGELDPATVTMRISGLDKVPAKYDPNSKMITYTPDKPLKPGNYTVIINGQAGTQKVNTRWSFTLDPNAKPGATDEAPLPPKR